MSTFTIDMLRDVIANLGDPLPPPPSFQCVPLMVKRTRGMWDRDVTPAERWQMWCAHEASDWTWVRNPICDAMPSNYVRAPDMFRGGEVIFCKGEAAYFHLLTSLRAQA